VLDIEGKQIIIRRATVKDVPAIAEIVNGYASQGLMLPRSLSETYQRLQRFTVVSCDGQIIGCGALHVFWDDLAEVRSLAVAEEWVGKGIGRLIVQHLLDEARSLEVSRVFTLTYRQSFFEQMGFHVLPKELLPQKIWIDCVNCPRYGDCDEIALILDDLGDCAKADAGRDER